MKCSNCEKKCEKNRTEFAYLSPLRACRSSSQGNLAGNLVGNSAGFFGPTKWSFKNRGNFGAFAKRGLTNGDLSPKFSEKNRARLAPFGPTPPPFTKPAFDLPEAFLVIDFITWKKSCVLKPPQSVFCWSKGAINVLDPRRILACWRLSGWHRSTTIASAFASWQCIAEDVRNENACCQDLCTASHCHVRVVRHRRSHHHGNGRRNSCFCRNISSNSSCVAIVRSDRRTIELLLLFQVQ